MSEFTGTLRERVTIERRLGNRDALAGASGRYAYEGGAWVAVSPLIPADMSIADSLSAMPRWQVTMRKREGIDQRTRLIWRGRFLGVRAIISDPQWAEIEKAVGRARQRGNAQTYVWALPQIVRDGYVHFQIGDESEADVQAFDDVVFPLNIGRGAEVSAEFSTNVVSLMSGHERRNSDWADARMSYDVAPGVRSEEELTELIDFFRARRGAAIAFRFGDPFDNSSNGASGPPSATDQRIGEGDGVRTAFRLVKNYGLGPSAQVRAITRPRPGTIIVAINGTQISAWTQGPLGEIRLDTAPAAGAAITAGYRFDVPVRFGQDRIDVNRATFGAGEMPSVLLVEIKEAV